MMPINLMPIRHQPCFMRSREPPSPCGSFPWMLLALALLCPKAVLFFAKVFVATTIVPAIGFAVFKMMCSTSCERTRRSTPPTRRVTDVGRLGVYATTDSAYQLTVGIPGVKQDDLSVAAEGTTLLVRGETAVGDNVFSADRRYEFPHDANVDEATATHRDGVLMFTVPKRAPSKARPINVQQTKERPVAPVQLESAQSSSPHEVATPSDSLPSTPAVLSECEPDPANVQAPEETTEEQAWEDDWWVRDHAMPSSQAAVPCTPPASPAAGPSGRDGVAEEQSEQSATAAEDKQGADGGESDEWDDLLDDLKEMGFDDRESNRLALAKHSGSIKQAVKELVTNRATGPSQ